MPSGVFFARVRHKGKLFRQSLEMESVRKNSGGWPAAAAFTLIELLVVIAIIAILAA